MKYKKKITGTSWSISELLGAVIILSLIGYTIYVGLAQWIEDKLLDGEAKVTKAIIIGERKYRGNSPVSQTYSYSYIFYIDGEAYKDDSRNTKFGIGDTVLVEYYPLFPSFNRLVEH
jgi:hypothetical protein